IPRPLDEVFPFFADARNLERITPAFLDFHFLTPLPIVMQSGTLIDYQIRLFGLPFKWQTRIEEFEPPHRFVDIQTRGPYRLWRHTHEFREIAEGTLVVDRVRYELPLGLLGTLAHALFVGRTLQKIFDFRQQTLGRMLDHKHSIETERLVLP